MSHSLVSLIFILTIFTICSATIIPVQYREIFQTGALSVTGSRNISTECIEDVLRVVSAARDKQLWALQMIDSCTKLPSGLLMGSINQIGNFKECLQVSSPDPSFKGRYTRPKLFVVNESSLEERFLMQVAVCTPSTCSMDDIAELVTTIAPVVLSSLLSPDETIIATVDNNTLSQRGYHVDPFTPYSWAYAGFMIMVVMISVLATIIDCWGNSAPAKTGMMATFSLRNATEKLFDYKTPKGDIPCLHGLRVLSMAWVIIGHHYSLFLISPMSNLAQVFNDFVHRPLYMTIGNAYLGVDSFFFLGGFLVCYGFMREMNRKQKFDIIPYYLYRFLRMTIPMAVIICFYVSFVSHLAEGPLWEQFAGKRLRIFCEKNWWAAMLYINNYINIWEQCLEQTWYTSADMQLFWMSPMILLPLYYSRRAGRQLLFLTILISCLIPFGITYKNKFPWAVDMVNPYDGMAYTQKIYLPTHSRATPYVVGLFAAHLLESYKAPMSKRVIWIGWIICTMLCIGAIYLLQISYNEGYVYNVWEASFYAGFHRLAWSLGLTWIVLACHRGHGGPINAILSWKYFKPLSKLTFGAYLTHLIVIIPLGGAIKSLTYVSHYSSGIHYFLAELPLVFVLSLFIYLTVESPLMFILRNAFARGNNNNKASVPVVSHTPESQEINGGSSIEENK